jgi:actin
MAAWEENAPVVLDNGSGVLKGGFAGEEQPRSVFASVIAAGRGANQGSTLLGDEAQAATKGYTLSYPIESGIVADWDGMEKLWRHVYRELNVAPADQAVLVTEAPLNPKANREKVAEVVFESLGVPAMQLQIQAVLSLYSGGRNDGLVFDSGDGVSHIVPVFDGHTVPSSIRRIDIAGRHLTDWMMQLLSDETDRPFTTSADRELARYVKEKSCYVAPNFDAELDALEGPAAKEKMMNLELPDGTTINIGRSRFGCPELLFDPSLADKSGQGVQHLICESVAGCPVDIRRTLLSNIVLSGGSTMFPGLEARLTEEVRLLTNPRAREDVRVIAPGERKYSVWMGAALLASLSSFAAEWITRADYDEVGPTIVHQRSNALDYARR